MLLNIFPLQNDAVVLGLLIACLAAVFYTSNLPSWSKFYKYVPSLLLCYFLPAILNSLGIISPDFYDLEGLIPLLNEQGYLVGTELSQSGLLQLIEEKSIPSELLAPYHHHSELYFVSSRYLLPASLVLLCLSIDLRGVFNLGPKALIMFFTATLGIVIGGPLALMLVSKFSPDLIGGDHPEALWRGLSTVAGSWIGGGANQTAMKEIAECSDKQFSAMIVVDVFVANIWMALLLIGAGMSKVMDKKLKADDSAIEALKQKVENYQAGIARIPSFTDISLILAVAFGAVAIAHFSADLISPALSSHISDTLEANPDSFWRFVTSLKSPFFWLVVIATIIGVSLSFTRARTLEGAGASRIGSIFLYILVATIGMKMNIGELIANWSIFKYIISIGLIWMLVHVGVLLLVAKLIKAPFFFVAVGSQANVGGAASAPIVASAFSPALAPVGVLLAVFGYAIGTFGAILCMELMHAISL